jgi:DNA-binding NtrC family response regulator
MTLLCVLAHQMLKGNYLMVINGNQGGEMNSDTVKRILLVDDEPSILLTISYALKAPGVEVISCNEIEQAEEALNNVHFDLVIADIRMSGVNGIEGLELLSYVKGRYKTEVIIMTGYGTDEMETEAYNRGALHYFKKPVDIPELLHHVSLCGIPVKSL